MRIVNLEQFLKLPDGTMFSKYEPCIFSGLMIKKGSIIEASDFFYINLIDTVEANDSGDFVSILTKAETEQTSFKLAFNCIERDGLFNKDQLFAVYEKQDVMVLINTLIWDVIPAYELMD